MGVIINYISENKKLCILLVICVIIIARLLKKRKNSALKKCISQDDLKFKVDAQQKRIEKEVVDNKRKIKAAKRKGYIKASITWIDNFQELTEVANTLNKNLEYENAKRLRLDKFHRYTSLHFRSLLLGNIAYEDYIASKKVRNEIKEMLDNVKKGLVNIPVTEKEQLYELKSVCINTTQYLYDRMIAIQNETAKLREKIGCECGEKGKAWYVRNRQNRK